MSKAKQDRDLSILRAISGESDPKACTMRIIEDYFMREAEENRKEQGFRVTEEEGLGFTDLEKDIFKMDREMSECERKRTNKPEVEYPRDENEVSIFLPKAIVTETIAV